MLSRIAVVAVQICMCHVFGGRGESVPCPWTPELAYWVNWVKISAFLTGFVLAEGTY